MTKYYVEKKTRQARFMPAKKQALGVFSNKAKAQAFIQEKLTYCRNAWPLGEKHFSAYWQDRNRNSAVAYWPDTGTGKQEKITYTIRKVIK